MENCRRCGPTQVNFRNYTAYVYENISIDFVVIRPLHLPKPSNPRKPQQTDIYHFQYPPTYNLQCKFSRLQHFAFRRNLDYRRRIDCYKLLNYSVCTEKCTLRQIAFTSQLAALQHTLGFIKFKSRHLLNNIYIRYIFFVFLVSLIPTGTQGINNASSPLTLDWASSFKSGQVLFRLERECSTVRLHISQGFPFLLPIPSRGFHCIACRATEFSSFRKVCPIQPHLCLLMIF